MYNLRHHIAFKLFAILVVAFFLAPTAVKFVHIFNHHTHKVCTNKKSTHIHQVDLDCDFFKFQINKTFTFSSFVVNLFSEKEIQPKIDSHYLFLSDFQYLHFSLRGPPQFNLV